MSVSTQQQEAMNTVSTDSETKTRKLTYFPFMRLPAEIRTMIYECHFEHCLKIFDPKIRPNINPPEYYTSIYDSSRMPELLETCRSIRYEALSVMEQKMTFDIMTAGDTLAIPEEWRQKVTKVFFGVGPRHASYCGPSYLGSLRNYLPNLREVHLQLDCCLRCARVVDEGSFQGKESISEEFRREILGDGSVKEGREWFPEVQLLVTVALMTQAGHDYIEEMGGVDEYQAEQLMASKLGENIAKPRYSIEAGWLTHWSELEPRVPLFSVGLEVS
jgi:hypothetical protein